MYHIAIVEDEAAFTMQLQEYLQQYQKENNVQFKISTFADVEAIKSKLNEAIKLAKADNQTGATVVQQVSAMDELKKLKELLDLGIVTQEEFDAKKKQLLGL